MSRSGYSDDCEGYPVKLSSIERDMLRRADKKCWRCGREFTPEYCADITCDRCKEILASYERVSIEGSVRASEAFKEAVKGRTWKW